LFLASLALSLAFSGQGLLMATTDAVEPFLKEHCVRCHGEKKQKGDFRIDTLSRGFSDGQAAEHWFEVITLYGRGRNAARG
jgi:hypothetical protein